MYSDLIERQVQILEFIKKSILELGYPPTVREIAKGVNLSSSATVHYHLEKLERLKYIKRDKSRPRAISILDPKYR